MYFQNIQPLKIGKLQIFTHIMFFNQELKVYVEK
jgi:hypothetical protein